MHNQALDVPLRAIDVRAQVNLIQEVMREVMQGPTKDNPEGVHYGLTPGCGNKPALLQPGAHKLIMTFKLVPDPEMTVIPMDRGHREVRCKVKLYSRSGELLGAGVGTCSTMEGKYRFRTGPVEFTDKRVPREYWDLRNADPAKAKQLLGAGYVAKKNDQGIWMCAIQGEKVEHDNPADYYNTVEKMAYKRALVSATLTVTAASDIFTQDIEEIPEDLREEAAHDVPAAVPTQDDINKAKLSAAQEALKKQREQPKKATAAATGNGDGLSESAHAETRRPVSQDAPSPQPPVTASMPADLDAAWLSEVLDCEDFLRGTQQGKGTLKSIREGFRLTDGAYPMLPEDQAQYKAMLAMAVQRMQAK